MPAATAAIATTAQARLAAQKDMDRGFAGYGPTRAKEAPFLLRMHMRSLALMDALRSGPAASMQARGALASPAAMKHFRTAASSRWGNGKNIGAGHLLREMFDVAPFHLPEESKRGTGIEPILIRTTDLAVVGSGVVYQGGSDHNLPELAKDPQSRLGISFALRS